VSRPPRRGDLHWVNLDPVVGSDIRKTRLAVIVSNDSCNRYAARVVVLPITSHIETLYPGEAMLEVNGKPSRALGDQIRSLDKTRLKLTLVGSQPTRCHASTRPWPLRSICRSSARSTSRWRLTSTRASHQAQPHDHRHGQSRIPTRAVEEPVGSVRYVGQCNSSTQSLPRPATWPCQALPQTRVLSDAAGEVQEVS
jgi:mRNA interferase MazF